ncbi:MAG: PRC-barrel domain-containing protein [Cyclobacteriaceae bacterium]|nr:PRC-barrel domain-containing protein [Cyclobacteriaceae bacterium]
MKTEVILDNLTGKNEDGPNANTPLQYLTATSLLANKVFNKADDKLGEVKDIMINVNTGAIEYAVIECGGFLGIGEKYFAIPYSLLSLDTEKECFKLDQSREALERAPGFDKDHWPKTNAHEFKTSAMYWGGFMGPHTGGF